MASSLHLVLARKWRPERFSDLVGQEHVTRTLEQALKSGRIAHAFLFTGIRGVGKTTAARILARCLDCTQGPTAEPCGNCAACQEIRSGSALDVVEIDGATYRKIDDARAIIENLGYRPARDRFKIYIIDEAHQLTDQAFNALLKTLEEPPAHVKFILATTEPQKMPETILSRLQRYDFRRIPFTIVRDRLRELGRREGVEIDDSALTLLAREASGSMRDAERMLETAIASLGEAIGESELAAILGVASRSRIFQIIGAILDKDPATALSAVRELNQRGANLESLGRDLLEMVRNLAVAKLPAASSPNLLLADLPDQEATELERLATRPSARDLMRLFHLMAEAQEQLTRSAYPDLMLEMTIIRMATLAPVLDADELMRAIGAAKGNGGNSGSDGSGMRTAGSATGAGGQPVSTRSPRSMEPTAANSSPRSSEESSSNVFEGNSAAARRIRFEGDVNADAPRRMTAPSPSAPESALVGTAGELPDLRDFIRSRRAALAGFMEQGASLKLNGDLLTVTPRSDIYVRYLTDNRNVIAELTSDLYGQPIKVEVATKDALAPALPEVQQRPDGVSELAAKPAPVPTSGVERAQSAANGGAPMLAASLPPPGGPPQADARQKLYADPVVRRIFEEFDARLVELKIASNPSSVSDRSVGRK
ncbi:MAG: DNA polymerase III subunit gamma/tau [Deltaproteobacteria bacterium]|nr:DNA polymerase III subunit gamma/tau [Deltaproteobacteria bacterium]